MKIFLIASLLLLSSLSCFGRLGETYEELIARYGEPVEVSLGEISLLEFNKGNFVIKAHIYKLKTYWLTYEKVQGLLSEDERRSLVKMNFAGEEVDEKFSQFYESKTYQAAYMDRKFRVYNKPINEEANKVAAAKKLKERSGELDGL